MRTQSRQQLEREILLSQRAHEMRRQSTRSEAALWAAIGQKQLGVAFRRQVPLGNRYIADFLAPSLKLVVEVDGTCHRERVTADARRTRVLQRLGYRVLRLDAEVVMRQLPVSVECVRNVVTALGGDGVP
jgi:very-short-patch-repair endonuclease